MKPIAETDMQKLQMNIYEVFGLRMKLKY